MPIQDLVLELRNIGHKKDWFAETKELRELEVKKVSDPIDAYLEDDELLYKMKNFLSKEKPSLLVKEIFDVLSKKEYYKELPLFFPEASDYINLTRSHFVNAIDYLRLSLQVEWRQSVAYINDNFIPRLEDDEEKKVEEKVEEKEEENVISLATLAARLRAIGSDYPKKRSASHSNQPAAIELEKIKITDKLHPANKSLQDITLLLDVKKILLPINSSKNFVPANYRALGERYREIRYFLPEKCEHPTKLQLVVAIDHLCTYKFIQLAQKYALRSDVTPKPVDDDGKPAMSIDILLAELQKIGHNYPTQSRWFSWHTNQKYAKQLQSLALNKEVNPAKTYFQDTDLLLRIEKIILPIPQSKLLVRDIFLTLCKRFTEFPNFLPQGSDKNNPTKLELILAIHNYCIGKLDPWAKSVGKILPPEAKNIKPLEEIEETSPVFGISPAKTF